MRKKDKKTIGQSITEFALMLPVILVLMFGIIEFGRLLVTYSMVTIASREAARYGVTIGDNGSGTPRYLDCAGMEAAALNIGQFGGLVSGDVTIQYDLGTMGGTLYTCGTLTTAQEDDIKFGDRVVITSTNTWSTIIPFLNLADVPITSISSRTIIKNAVILAPGD